eukprot:m.24553 g.24553  ORF g.24553 m.24553 type:complete len:71 (+) comp7618_c0_seq1:3201-3413(+)
MVIYWMAHVCPDWVTNNMKPLSTLQIIYNLFIHYNSSLHVMHGLRKNDKQISATATTIITTTPTTPTTKE